MSLNVAKYPFEGPYSTTDNLQDKSGVYVIVGSSNGTHNPVDVGESSQVKSRIENHDRKSCWKRHCNQNLAVAVLYTPHLQQQGRMQIEQKIRDTYNFPCGIR
jgi:hypothetical protein